MTVWVGLPGWESHILRMLRIGLPFTVVRPTWN